MANDKKTAKQQRDEYLEKTLTEEFGANGGDYIKPSIPLLGGIGTIYDQKGMPIGGGGMIGEKVQSGGRVGDYTYSAKDKEWKLVENSPTDIAIKKSYTAASPKQNLSITDYASIAKAGALGVAGLPTDAKNVGSMLLTTAVGQVARKLPTPFSLVWGAVSAANESNRISQKYLDEYNSQDFDYKFTGDVYKDKDGSIKVKQKFLPGMATAAGTDSGSDVINATNTDRTGVEFTGDGKMKVKVSPLFSKTNEYKDFLKWVDEEIPYVTKEEAEKKSEETGYSLVDYLSNEAKKVESNYYYVAAAAKSIKDYVPNASDQAVYNGVETIRIGYEDEEGLSNMEVTVYNEQNQEQKVNAKEYLDSIKAMDKLQRQDYMSSIGARLADPNISDDEKAVLYAQSQALYAASNNDGEYKNMYNKDFFDSIGDIIDPVFGKRLGSYVGAKELSTFQEDELRAAAFSLGETAASLFTLSKITNGIEKAFRKATPSISRYAGTSIGREFASAKSTGANVLDAAKTAALKGVAQFNYQVAADAAYDAAKIIPYALTGTLEEYDFLEEFKTDIMLDMMMTYGPSAFSDIVNKEKKEYKALYQNKKGKTAYFHPKDVPEGYERVNDVKDLRQRYERVDEDGKKHTEYFKRGEEIPEGYKLVEKGNKVVADDVASDLIDQRAEAISTLGTVTNEELAVRKTKDMSKLLHNDLVYKTVEQFFDKDIAMTRLAIDVRAAGGDAYLYRKIVDAANLQQLTKQMQVDFFKNNENAARHVEDLKEKLSAVAKRSKDFTKADADYINATANMRRFLIMHKGDKNAQNKIRQFYKPYIDKVDADRAQQLDELAEAMRALAGDILPAYKKMGMMSDEEFEKITGSPEYQGGWYLPVWKDYEKKVGEGPKTISKTRAKAKKVFNPDNLIPVEDLANPLSSLTAYMHNGFQNQAVQYQRLLVREAASIPGMKTHTLKDTGGSLKEVKNLSELSASFKKKYDKIVKDVEKEFFTYEEWAKQNATTVLRSKALKTAKKIDQLQKNLVKIRENQRKAAKESKKAPTLAPSAVLALMDRKQVSNALRSQGVKSGSVAKNLFTQVGKARSNSKEAQKKYEAWKFRLDEKTDKWLNSQIKKNGGGKTGYAGFLEARKNIGEKFDDAIDRKVLENNPEFTKSKEFAVFSAFKASEDAFFERQRLAQEAYANKQEQEILIDQLKEQIEGTMRRVAKKNKGYNSKLDIRTYVDVTLTNKLKSALKGGINVGKISAIFSEAVDAANPYIDRNLIIERRAELAAEKFRKDVNRNLAIKKNVKGKDANDYINALTDKVMDYVTRKVSGKKKSRGTAIIDPDRPTRILNNYNDPHTIRYMQDGEEQRLTLTGHGSEELVKDLTAPEEAPKRNWLRKASEATASVAQLKRYLTTATNPTRALPNLLRDWSRGIVTTGGKILFSPEDQQAQIIDDMIASGRYTDEEIKIATNGWKLVNEEVAYSSTFNQSFSGPWKNRPKKMIQSMNEPDGNAFERVIYHAKTGQVDKLATTLQDEAEAFTRSRAIRTAYNDELAKCISAGYSIEDSIARAVEAGRFYGREATVNFGRRGKFIAKFARHVPYLSQNFGSLESFALAYLDNPIGVTRSLEATLYAYTNLIAIALADDESRKRYYNLSEYDRSHNIIIPIDDGMIMTIPLDENIAAFLTPYRRMVETLNGVDPQAFFLCFAEGIGDLSPIDVSGFFEGDVSRDGLNITRGVERAVSGWVPTLVAPLYENWVGRDLYYGSSISVDEDTAARARGEDYTGAPGDMSKASKYSPTLAAVSNFFGIPQWQIQNIFSEYGGGANGSFSQFALGLLDDLQDATRDWQGTKSWTDSVFKPLTGSDSKEVTSRFWDAVQSLKNDREKLRKELKAIQVSLDSAVGNNKAVLEQKRQDKINAYGKHVTELLNQYISAYEITGGLPKNFAKQLFWLYNIYDIDTKGEPTGSNSSANYYRKKMNQEYDKLATDLAAGSGADSLIGTSPISSYYDTYSQEAISNLLYGQGDEYIANMDSIFKDNSINRTNMWKDWQKMDKAQQKKWKAKWNTKVVTALKPYIDEIGIENFLNNTKAVSYLANPTNGYIFVNPYQVKQYLKEIFK